MTERLRELRKLLGLSQSEFADKLGMKQGSLSDIERGKVGLSNSNVVLICNLFNVDEDWLRRGEGKPFSNKYEHRQDLTELEKDILTKFNKLSASERVAVATIIDGLWKSTHEEGGEAKKEVI